MQLRKICTFIEEVHLEGSRAAARPVTSIVVAAVLGNPWAGRGFVEDLRPEIVAIAPRLGQELTRRLIGLIPAERMESYARLRNRRRDRARLRHYPHAQSSRANGRLDKTRAPERHPSCRSPLAGEFECVHAVLVRNGEFQTAEEWCAEDQLPHRATIRSRPTRQI